MSQEPPKGIYRFGVYEADIDSGELRKSGLRVRLQEQPFQVLLVLLRRPGEVISREELHQKLWASDTFVDFDHGLNTVINRLREALNDSASNPRFIETLSRRGYRFLAPVEFVEKDGAIANERLSRPSHEVGVPARSQAVPGNTPALPLLTHPDEVPPVSHGHVRLLFFLIQVMYLCFYVAALARLARIQDLLETVLRYPAFAVGVIVATAVIGLPVRLYFLSSISFGVSGLTQKFHKLFVFIFALDELWALSPFLLAPQIGLGLALAAVAALIYVPFAQRTLLLMGDRSPRQGAGSQ